MGNLKHELDVVALKSARMSKTQLNTGRVQVGDLREVARLELLELLDRLLFLSSSEKLNFFPAGFLVPKLLYGILPLQAHSDLLLSISTSRNMR